MRNKILVSILVIACIIASIVVPVCALAAPGNVIKVEAETLPEESVVKRNKGPLDESESGE